MAWPSTLTTNHLDSDTDSPKLARAEILATAVAVNAIIDSRGAASGVASLDATTRIPAAQLPAVQTTTTTFQPTSERITVKNIVNLYPQTVAALSSVTGSEGDVAFCSNGDAGSPCLAVYDGSNWLVVSLGSTISAT